MSAIVVLGDEGQQGGVYLLRLRAAEPLAVRFGRFRGGAAVAVPAGEAVYVGSARRGLAPRLLRHASRASGQPHPIRAQMLDEFAAVGLGALRVPAGKKLRWHVDYLLEETAVILTHALLIRTAALLEEPLARWLVAQPQTRLIAPGLGASDAGPGGASAHLLAVAAPEEWWDVKVLHQAGEN
jgi:Uri superfamily endonuclease